MVTASVNTHWWVVSALQSILVQDQKGEVKLNSTEMPESAHSSKYNREADQQLPLVCYKSPPPSLLSGAAVL